jgi:hypothetical protein
MFTMPVSSPVITPVPVAINAVAGLLLLHVPPVVAIAAVVVAPLHTVVATIIVAGVGDTVTTTVFTQPVGAV